MAATLTNTAWSGPWGVSFNANLTPHPSGILEEYTEEQFIQAMRTGRHLGQGRPILPPMPWPAIGQMRTRISSPYSPTSRQFRRSRTRCPIRSRPRSD